MNVPWQIKADTDGICSHSPHLHLTGHQKHQNETQRSGLRTLNAWKVVGILEAHHACNPLRAHNMCTPSKLILECANAMTAAMICRLAHNHEPDRLQGA